MNSDNQNGLDYTSSNIPLDQLLRVMKTRFPDDGKDGSVTLHLEDDGSGTVNRYISEKLVFTFHSLTDLLTRLTAPPPCPHCHGTGKCQIDGEANARRS